MPECLFCKIAAKQIPSSILYEDDKVVAFQDVSPQAPLHALIVPRKHIPGTLELAEADNALLGHMVQVANRLAREKGVAERGFRLVMNTNAEAGQSVFHMHMHVLGGRPMGWPPG
ncbi:MAG: histidine triad nucleotide-binding protein [Nitrospirota bacterium]|jgi:histidine triad (HIT) family protein